VFERFFRIPGSDAQGSGLGLAIVRRLAEALGSTVQLGPGLDGRGLSVALSLRSAAPVGLALDRSGALPIAHDVGNVWRVSATEPGS
jgi:hypothetical protein